MTKAVSMIVGGSSGMGKAVAALLLEEDPSLVAGPVLRLESCVLDASIAGQVSLLQHRARGLLQEGAALD